MFFTCLFAGPQFLVRSKLPTTKAAAPLPEPNETSPLLPQTSSSDHTSGKEPSTAPVEPSELFSAAAPLLLSQADPSLYRQSPTQPLNDQSLPQKHNQVPNTWSVPRSPLLSSDQILEQTQTRLTDLRGQYKGESQKNKEREAVAKRSVDTLDSKFDTDGARVKRQATALVAAGMAAAIMVVATGGLILIPLAIGAAVAAVSIGVAVCYAHLRHNKIESNYLKQTKDNQKQIWDASRRAMLLEACAYTVGRILDNTIGEQPISPSREQMQQTKDLLKYCFEYAGDDREGGFIHEIKSSIKLIYQSIHEIDTTVRDQYERMLDDELLKIQGILLEKHAQWANAQKREQEGTSHPFQEALLTPSA